TEWDLSFDYLGDRGFGHGTTFVYSRERLLSVPAPISGLFDYWGIKDGGLDNLGRGRNGLVPEEDYRFRLFWQHRQQLPGDFRLFGQIGWISDRNFLEGYYKREWDELKDQTTGVELKRVRDNTSFSVTADARLNDFFTQTEWLPRADHFWLGQSLFHDVFTWYEHSHAAYARFRSADAPANPNDTPFNWLRWERTALATPIFVEGERLATRQEIDWPLQLGLVKVVPYALGELAHWGEDASGDDIQRAYWQAGVRASMPMWRADPTVESTLLNVHGLAHKVVFDAEFAFAEANRDLSLLPLYDPLDDDSIEAFRRRLAMNTFGMPAVPRPFDERIYALRTGIGSWVTSPTTEIADDLMALRMGVRQRWQTKRGMPGNRRIIDWIVLDSNVTWFPDETRDNFGTVLGLLDYDFRWHVGDRLTLVSDGIFDFFADGQQVITVGGFLTRPPRGSLYLGLRLLQGPISHQILSISYSYWMSPKWLSWFGTSVDLGGEGNIGQTFGITRIGESFLVSAGFSVDAARDNVGVNFQVEPRFLPKGRLSRVGGARIPVAGAFGLE
ncbi:MAG: organic solvent tolerance protein OstA, partial [Planctomycetota bacterium]